MPLRDRAARESPAPIRASETDSGAERGVRAPFRPSFFQQGRRVVSAALQGVRNDRKGRAKDVSAMPKIYIRSPYFMLISVSSSEFNSAPATTTAAASPEALDTRDCRVMWRHARLAVADKIRFFFVVL
jgi:hypothetical protein